MKHLFFLLKKLKADMLTGFLFFQCFLYLSYNISEHVRDTAGGVRVTLEAIIDIIFTFHCSCETKLPSLIVSKNVIRMLFTTAI